MDFKNYILISTVVLIVSTDVYGGSVAKYSYGYRNFMSRNGVIMCDGEENLKSDIGIISFVLGGISSVAGLFSLTEFSVPSNNISIISTVLSLILWVPSAVLTFLATSDPFSYITGNLVNIFSLIVTLYGGLGIVTGTADIIVSTMDEVLGITSLILSSLTTFPDMYDESKQLLQELLGKDEVDQWIRGYGCGGSSGRIPGFFRDLNNLVVG